MKESTRSGLRGEIRPPSDKSLTHRALLFASLARGRSEIINPLLGDDPLSTAGCLKLLGHDVNIVGGNPSKILIDPSLEWKQPLRPLDCGNSGTTARLISGLLASHEMRSELIGDTSLSKRPMKRIQIPLKKMGAHFEGEYLPMKIGGRDHLQGIEYESPVASAQVKSAVLLAGLRANSPTTVIEPSLSRDHTERILRSLGVRIISQSELNKAAKATIYPQERIESFVFSPPADISSAAFWLIAACIVPCSDISLLEVGLNPTRTGILDVLKMVEAEFSISDQKESLGEPYGTISLKFKDGLKPFKIGGSLVARLIDEIPILCVLATQLHGVSTIRDAKELRVKESDRIEEMALGLRAMGANVETFEDGLSIEGPTQLQSANIQAKGDHRIAMSFTIASMIAKETNQQSMSIEGTETISTSYPTFYEDMRTLLNG